MYDGDTDQVTLSGAVRTNDATSAMWSRELTFDRSTGNAHASGPLKVDYAASDAARTGDGDVMHILADRADMDGASSSATFYGRPVRVWQGGNQIQAPEVIVRRDSNELAARGATGTSGSGAVRTTLVSAPDTNGERSAAGSSSATGCRVRPTDSSAAGAGAPGGANVVRITSGGLVYAGGQHRVDFTGGVRAEAPNATIHAREATALLAGERQTQSRAIPTMDGGLKRIVAIGPVDLTRAGTRAFGDKLVYEAASQTFVLSGSGREPARAVDVRGKTAAAAFRFNGCDDTLEALGQAPDTERQRVDTDAVQSGAKKRENAGR
jgi:lipopolysaccharide export system protein LptA